MAAPLREYMVTLYLDDEVMFATMVFALSAERAELAMCPYLSTTPASRTIARYRIEVNEVEKACM